MSWRSASKRRTRNPNLNLPGESAANAALSFSLPKTGPRSLELTAQIRRSGHFPTGSVMRSAQTRLWPALASTLPRVQPSP